MNIKICGINHFSHVKEAIVIEAILEMDEYKEVKLL